MQDSENELVIAAAKPPATFREIHPDLSKNYSGTKHAGMAVLFAFTAVTLGCLTSLWDWRAGIIVVLVFVYLIRFVLTSGKSKHDYLRYASWIFKTERGRNEELKLSEKFVSQHKTGYFVTIKNEKGEELYDVQAMSSQLQESQGSVTATVFRDPRNGLAVVATIGDTRVWLRQYLPY